jgi:hypothetical protein
MANKLYRGAQMQPSWKRSMTLANVTAPLGAAMVLPIILADTPHNVQAVRLFFGPPGGPHKLACQGVEYSVDAQNHLLTWLATARWPLTLSEVVIDYYTLGAFA